MECIGGSKQSRVPNLTSVVCLVQKAEFGAGQLVWDARQGQVPHLRENDVANFCRGWKML